jgi:hypothetical protein
VLHLIRSATPCDAFSLLRLSAYTNLTLDHSLCNVTLYYSAPSRVVVLCNMVGRGGVDDALSGEVKKECEQHGRWVLAGVHHRRHHLDIYLGRDRPAHRRLAQVRTHYRVAGFGFAHFEAFSCRFSDAGGPAEAALSR